jgi:hypothetical protein
LAEEAGVRVFVDGAAWKGEPYGLPRVLTPVKVAIENGSGRRLRVAYRDFALVSPDGFRYAALSPLPGQLQLSRADALIVPVQHPATPARNPPAVAAPRFRHHEFYIAPHYGLWYPGFHAWPNMFFYDPGAYARSSWSEPLPTMDMLAEALPEGVLEPGGYVEGFVYFRSVGNREAEVAFEMELVDADGELGMGLVKIPFTVRD